MRNPILIAVLLSSAACTSSSKEPDSADRAASTTAKPRVLTARPTTGHIASRADLVRRKARKRVEVPCQRCQLDLDRRLRGQLRTLKTCGPSGKPLVYPLRNPQVEVLTGRQAGQRFPVHELPASMSGGEVLDGRLGLDAEIAGWEDTLFWVEDAEGTRCPSALPIAR